MVVETRCGIALGREAEFVEQVLVLFKFAEKGVKDLSLIDDTATERKRKLTRESILCNVVSGVVSPVLSNPYLHYALDHWLAMRHKGIPFCRYADDGVPRALNAASAAGGVRCT